MQHDVDVGAAVADVDDAVVRCEQLCAQLFEDGHLAVAGGDPQDGFDLACRVVIAEARAEDVVRRYDAFERRLDDLFGRRRDDVEGEAVAVQIVEQLHQQANILLQADLFAGFHQVMFPDAAILRVVQDQVGQLAALLHQMDVGKTGDALLERADIEHFAEHDPRVVKTQRLVEVTHNQILFSR